MQPDETTTHPTGDAQANPLAPFTPEEEASYRKGGRYPRYGQELRLLATLNAERAKVAEAERQRDLATAHDTQPYPTAHAYETACKALDAARAKVTAERDAERAAHIDAVKDVKHWERCYYEMRAMGNGLYDAIVKRLTPHFTDDPRALEWDVLPSTLGALVAERDALAKFKAYVHARLDAAGVPVDPESTHKAEGCRIGGRLDWLLDALAGTRERAEKAEAVSSVLLTTSDGAKVVPGMTVWVLAAPVDSGTVRSVDNVMAEVVRKSSIVWRYPHELYATEIAACDAAGKGGAA